MDSNIVAQITSGTTVSTDTYLAIEPRSAYTTTQANSRSVIPITCTFKNFYISYVTAAGGGLARTFTLQKNGVDTAVTVTITDPATSGNDTTHQVNFAPGDTAQIRTSATGTTANFGISKFTIGYTAAAHTTMVLSHSVGTTMSTSATNYMTIQGDIPVDTNPVNVEQVMPTNGTFRNAYVDLNAAIGASPRTITFTLYKNGSPTSIVVTVSNNGSTANDLTHTVSVAAGDRFYWECVPSGTPSARVPHIGMEFNPTINGEGVRLMAVNTAPSTSAANSMAMMGSGTTWSATDNNRSGLTQACTFKKLYVYLAVAPGGSAQYTIQTSVGGTAGNPSCVVSGSNQTNNDTSNTVTATIGQTASFRVTPASTPAATNVEAGIVSYIAPNTTPGGSLTSLGVGA